MQRVSSSGLKRRRGGFSSFTLVELLTVMLVIAILVGLTLFAAGPAMNKLARSRAAGEIQAMSSSLESYKIDNGIFPPGYIGTNATTGLLGGTNAATSTYPLNPSTAGGNYQVGSQALFEALAGRTNYFDTPVNKSYMTFKSTQLGNGTTASGTAYSATTSTYIVDPWGYSYGYSTGDGTANNIPYSGSGFFDLWSTGNMTANPSGTVYATNSWIANWRNN